MQFKSLGKLDLTNLTGNQGYLEAVIASIEEDTKIKLRESLNMGSQVILPKIIREYLLLSPERADFFVGLDSILNAYKKVCTPELISRIRNQKAAKQDRKKGTDFATLIDKALEDEIRESVFEKIGKDNIQIFGEEAGKYLGSPDAKTKFRLDPVDGTLAFKTGSDERGIMLGKYQDRENGEEQDWHIVLYPEKEGVPVLLFFKDLGVFLVNTQNNSNGEGKGDFVKLPKLREQNDINDITITIWKHTNLEESHTKMQAIEQNLRIGSKNGKPLQIKSTYSACGDILSSLIKQGRQVIMIDGDFNEVDFIPFVALENLGYKIYDWNGEGPFNAADTSLKNKKLVVVPPGKAGEEIRTIIKDSI